MYSFQKILSVLFVFCILNACKKNTENTLSPSLNFKANGIQYEWNGALSSLTNDTIGAAIVNEYRFGVHTRFYLFSKDWVGSNNNKLSLDISSSDSVLTTSVYHSSDNPFSTPNYEGMILLAEYNNNISYNI